MNSKKSLYITTTLPYVNAVPHIGFALEVIQADVLARHYRKEGNDVFFNTGTDEHGQKIFDAAAKAEENVQDYVDRHANEYLKLKGILDLSFDAFIRTTDSKHITAAQEMWRKCKANGDIYEKEFEGQYCVGCERYLTQKDLVDGKCQIHGKEPEIRKEKNWFFRFKNYEEKLIEYLSNPFTVIPDWRRQEAINFVKDGLEDFSISREKEKLAWGIPVPDDEAQVMYVWFDALTNYISTLGWPGTNETSADKDNLFNKYWTEGRTLQMAGKDQVRFQSLMWQAMLMSAGVKTTDQIFYHGFINSGGNKMSKSLGNVISPYDLVNKYGTDATRYLLLRHVHSTEDTDVTWDKLDEWYTGNLANGLGNLVSRVLALTEKNLGSFAGSEVLEEGGESLEKFNFQTAMDAVWQKIQKVDEKIAQTEPYRLVKSEPEVGKKILEELRTELYFIASDLDVFMPATSVAIKKAVLENKKPAVPLFPRLEA